MVVCWSIPAIAVHDSSASILLFIRLKIIVSSLPKNKADIPVAYASYNKLADSNMTSWSQIYFPNQVEKIWNSEAALIRPCILPLNI